MLQPMMSMPPMLLRSRALLYLFGTRLVQKSQKLCRSVPLLIVSTAVQINWTHSPTTLVSHSSDTDWRSSYTSVEGWCYLVSDDTGTESSEKQTKTACKTTDVKPLLSRIYLAPKFLLHVITAYNCHSAYSTIITVMYVLNRQH